MARAQHTYLLFLAALASTSPSVDAAELEFAPETELFVGVHLPSKRFATASLSDLVDIVFEQARRSTSLRPSVIPDTVMQECTDETTGNQGMACLVTAARRDYSDWAVDSDRRDPIPQRILDATGSGRFMLLLSAVGADRLVALLLDTTAAIRIIHDAAPEEQSNVESRLAAEAIAAVTLPTELDDRAELEAFIERLFEDKLSRVFERAGVKGRFGRIQLRPGEEDSAWIILDGRKIGRLDGATTIRNVPPGDHRLRLEEEGLESFEGEVQVPPGERVSLRPVLRAQVWEYTPLSRQVLLWTGVGVGLVGVGLAALSFADDEAGLCAGAACSDRTFRAFGGVPLLPLGYSLAGAGAAWSLGSLLGSERDVPWIELVSGLVVFGAAFGLSVALDPGCSGPACVDGR